MRIAVTGGIGCGKSTVCGLLAKQLPNYVTFSVDDAVRSLYQRPEYLQELQQKFNTCDRKVLSDLVFSVPGLREELEDLAARHVQPLIEEALSHPKVIFEFPLLFEMGWATRFDHVIGLTCGEDTQRSRVMARDKMTGEKFERIRAAQLSTSLKAALADDVIDTDVALPELTSSVARLTLSLKLKALRLRCEQFFGSTPIADAVFAAYTASGRHYHGLEHLLEMFETLDPHLKNSPHAFAIEAAVWFHDYVYETDPKAYGNNEALSARALYQLCRRFAPHLLQEPSAFSKLMLACEFILSTKGHRVTAPAVLADPKAFGAASLFLDADLAILAADVVRLQRYDADIAREWGFERIGASLEFCRGRASALESFLSREKLYFSEELSHLEPAARANLASLVEHWRNWVVWAMPPRAPRA